MSHFARLVASLALASAACACTEGKTFIATASDFADYRATRIEPVFDDRVVAASRYLEKHPHGQYRDEVKAYYARAEILYFSRHEKTIEGLETYLANMPKGPHADEAKESLAVKQWQAGKPDSMLAGAAETARRLEANKRSRDRARDELHDWLVRSMSKEVFASPLEQGPKAFVVPFSLGLPPPKCTEADASRAPVTRVCKKLIDLPYVIPTHHTYEQRTLTFDVAVETDAAGHPVRIVIAGPDLFARLQETSAKQAIDAGDTDKRIDSVEGASLAVTSAFQDAVSSESSCAEDVAAPDLVHLRCGGIDVLATIGTKEGADDLVVIEPVN